MKLSALRTNEGRMFQTVEAQHENRAAMFVDEWTRVSMCWSGDEGDFVYEMWTL